MNKKNKLLPELRFPEFKDSGNWSEKTLDQILQIGNGRDYKHLDEGDVPVYGSGGYMLSVNSYLHDGESVCIGRKGTIDKPIFLSGKFWTVDTLFYTHSFKDCIPKFIYYVFHNIDWLQHNEAGGIPSLSKSNISKIKITIPNIDEQNKIACCLSSLDELLSSYKKKIEFLKSHKRGLVQNLFVADGQSTPNYRFPEFKNKTKWRKKLIGNLTSVTSGGTPESGTIKYWNGNIPWMSSGELNNKRIYKVSNSITEEGLKNSSTKMIPKECILIGLAGQGKTRGTAAINYLELCTNQSIAAIHPNPKSFNSEFLYQLIESMYKKLRSLSTGDGGRGGLNLTIIKSIEIYLPDLDEQLKIANCLETLDLLALSHEQKIKQIELHRKALIQRLFPKMNN